MSLVVAINQFSFAFGPTLLGQLQQARGSYGTALLVCLTMQAMAAIIVVSPVTGRRTKVAALLTKRWRRYMADAKKRSDGHIRQNARTWC